MTPDEWNKIALDYEHKVKQIRIMPTVSHQDIKELLASIDTVLTDALFDLSRASQHYEVLSAKCLTAMSELFLEAKRNDMSDEKSKHYARVQAAKSGVIDMKLEAERRLTFMQNVVSLLKEKREMLVIDYGILKTEAQI